MCFVIDPKAKRPKAKFVYKRLMPAATGPKEGWISPYYPGRWKIGMVKKLMKKTCKPKQNTFLGNPQSHRGFYVYTSRRQALLKKKPDENVFQMKVNPKDWCHSSGLVAFGREAVYCKIKVVKRVA